MHILQIASGWGLNGAIVHCLELTRGLVHRGHKLTLVCRPNSWIAKQLRGEAVEIVESDLGRFPPADLGVISRYCREHGVDLVHTHQSRAHFFGVLLRRLFNGPPVVATAHRCLFQPHWPWNDLVIATSEETARFQARWNLVPRRKMPVVRNFIEAERFRAVPIAEGHRVRRELGLASDAIVVGVIGTVEPRKGLLHLVNALPRLVATVPRIKILAAGFQHPGYTSQVAARAKSLGVADHLLLPGQRSDVAAVMRALDIFAMPSLNESLPLALLEAMALGLPIVATAVGGVPECIEDGVHGRLIPPARPNAIAETIEAVLSTSDRGQSLGQAAAERIDREFSPKVQIDKIEQHFRQLLERTGRRAA